VLIHNARFTQYYGKYKKHKLQTLSLRGMIIIMIGNPIHTYIRHNPFTSIHYTYPYSHDFFSTTRSNKKLFLSQTLKGGRNKLYGQNARTAAWVLFSFFHKARELIEWRRPFPVYVNHWSATNTNRGSSVDKRCRDISAVAQDFNLVDPLLVILDSSSLTSNLEGITITPTKETCRSTIS
jgi:hypothetical protein